MPIQSGQIGRYGVKATPDILGPHQGIPWRSPALSNAAPTITGVTRESNGVALGSCTVWAMNTQTDAVMGSTTSDSNGVFSLTLYTSGSFYIVAYKAGLVSALPSQMSLTRASSGTYFDSSGTLQTASTNTARFNYKYNGTAWVPAGLLLEQQNTNFITQAFIPSNVRWVAGGVTITAGTKDLQGSNNAVFLKNAASTAGHGIFVDGDNLSAGSVYTLRVYVSQGTAPFVWFQDWNNSTNFYNASLKWSDMSVATNCTSVGATMAGPYLVGMIGSNLVYAVDMTYTHEGTSAAQVGVGPATQGVGALSPITNFTDTSVGTETCYVYGCLYYDGPSRPTISPILTTTVGVTRSADILSSTNATLLAAKGWIVEVGEAKAATAGTLLGVNTAIGLGENTSNQLTTADGGTQTSTNTGDWTSTNRGGIAFDTTPRVTIDLNGSTITTAANTPVTVTALYFGNTNNGASGFLNAHLRSVAAYSAITDAQLPTLATVGASFTSIPLLSPSFSVNWVASDVSGTTVNTLIPT